MSIERDEMKELENFLSAARQEAPGLRAGLRGRILADALEARQPQSEAPLMVRFSGWFYGWALPGTVGGAVAALVGFWVGFAAPMPPDTPFWMFDTLAHLDSFMLPLGGVIDPLVMGF
ncbi:MAG: hypothetical protein EA407_07450 [Rhodobacteraceae bacterium]|nr:MAG: hypothetical protein EA407_07450 [Paracoccaceae bacterium]